MSKHKLKIVDTAFAHCEYSNNPLPPTSFSPNIEWDRDVSADEELVFYTDNHIRNPHVGHKKRIAWLLEPRCKQPHNYDWISKNNHLYDYVLTHDKQLIEQGKNFIYYALGGCWIEVENRRTDHIKSKLVSMITSGKKNVSDHFKRHEIIAQHRDVIDVMGRGYKTIEPISKGLKDYMFHIAMENQTEDYYFSEKIINPIMTGTIPIYYGPDHIKEIFDTRGMILFNNINQIPQILKDINHDVYQQMLPYAVENFERAQQYILSEDWMIENNVFEKLGIKLG
tara:strand:- start:921 stop:1766 length:846 start_codon:yes stop_codon:yes gene_type:complete